MKLDLETHLAFDGSISTETRFGFRKWLEGWCEVIGSMDKQGEWTMGLSSSAYFLGLKDRPLAVNDFCDFVERQHEKGGFALRVPSGLVKNIAAQNIFELSGEIECYTNNVLSCAGPVKIFVHVGGGQFLLESLEVHPRFRVVDE